MGNHNSGRRPKPTALHILNGNPSRKNLNTNEVRPPAGEIAKPAGLSRVAEAVWDELAPICLAMGTLTTADVRAFGTLCELQSTMQQTSASKDGRELFRLERQDDDDPQGPMEIVVDAALRLERETAQALRPYYEYFGMTPSSRARLAFPKPHQEQQGKWAGALT